MSLADLSWHRLQPAPFRAITTMPTTSIWSYQGLPTIFGHPTCDDDGVCPMTDVVQFDPVANEWSSIGNLNEPTLWNAFIEVPASFCLGLEAPEDKKKPPVVPNENKTSIIRKTERDSDSVALIIGGLDLGYEGSGPAASTAFVELYGCDGGRNPVSPFPARVRETAATYVPADGNEVDYVLVCGGYQCPRSDPGCLDLSGDCYAWFPSTNAWEPAESLVQPRRDHILVQVC